MVDIDRWEFRFDLASLPITGGFLFFVLLMGEFTRSVDLVTVASGGGVVLCVVATAASLLLVRNRLTDWEAPVRELQMLRLLLPVGWTLLNPLMGMWEEPLWQLLIGLPLIFATITMIVMILVLICSVCLTTPADESPQVANGS